MKEAIPSAALRNVLIHKYFGVDLNIVWGVVEQELPPLKQRLQQLIETSQDS